MNNFHQIIRYVSGLQNIPLQNEVRNKHHPLYNLNTVEVRHQFAEYFASTEGAVPWQREKVLKNAF